jgi:hypothetical protein
LLKYECVLIADMDDVEKYMPGFMQNTVDWFRCYKIPDGKPENNFAFDGKAKGRVSSADASLRQLLLILWMYSFKMIILMARRILL